MKKTKLSDTLEKIWKKAGKETQITTIPIRDCQDVPNFLKKLKEIQEKTRNSKLKFGFGFGEA